MGDDLLNYYHSELTYINHVSEEFAKQNPKVAGQLGMGPNANLDPHIERFIQASAFINARTRAKLDSGLPEISEALLSNILPDYVSPIPSMSIVRFHPELGMAKKKTIKKGQYIETVSKNQPRCVFKTCYDTDIWPMAIVDAKMVSSSNKTSRLTGQVVQSSLLKIKIETIDKKIKFSKLAPDSIRFFIKATPQHANVLYDMIMSSTHSISITSTAVDEHLATIPPENLQQVGFELHESVLESQKNSFPGYRLITECMAFPAKFLFFDITNIDASSYAGKDNDIYINFFLSDANKDLENFVDRNFFELGCTPVINTFKKTLEPIHYDHREFEYRIVPDVNQEYLYSIYKVDSVTAKLGTEKPVDCMPFYSINHSGRDNSKIYWHTKRRKSFSTKSSQKQSYDMYMSLAEVDESGDTLKQDVVLNIDATVTNGDAPSMLLFGLDEPKMQFMGKRSDVSKIECVLQPTRQHLFPTTKTNQWLVVSCLALNYLSLLDTEGGAGAFREILHTFDVIDDTSTKHLIEGIVSISSKPVLERDPSQQLNAFCKGIQVEIEYDESYLVGNSLIMFASVLDRFLAMYCSINSFVKLRVVNFGKTKVIHEWKPRSGKKALL